MKNQEFGNDFDQASFLSPITALSAGRRQIFVLPKKPKEKGATLTVKPLEAISTVDFSAIALKKEEKEKKKKIKETTEEFEEKEEEEEEEMEEFEEKLHEAIEEFEEKVEEETLENEEVEEREEDEIEKPEKEEESENEEVSQEVEIDHDKEDKKIESQSEKIPSSFFYVASHLLQHSSLGSNKISLQPQTVQSEGTTIEEIESEISDQEKEEPAVTYDQNSEIEEEEEEEFSQKESTESEKQIEKQGKDLKKENLKLEQNDFKEDKKQNEENLKEERETKQKEEQTEEKTKERAIEKKETIKKKVFDTSFSNQENKKESARNISDSDKTNENQKNAAADLNSHLSLGITSSLLPASLSSTKKNNESDVIVVAHQQNIRDGEFFKKEDFIEEKPKNEKKDSNLKIDSVSLQPLEPDKRQEVPKHHIEEKTSEGTISVESQSRFSPFFLSSASSSSSSVPFLSFSTCSVYSSFSSSSQTSQDQDKKEKFKDLSHLGSHPKSQTKVGSQLFDQTLKEPKRTNQYRKSENIIHAREFSQMVSDSKKQAQMRTPMEKSSKPPPPPLSLRNKEKKVSRHDMPHSSPRLSSFLVSTTDDLSSGSNNHHRTFHGGSAPKHNKQKKTRWKDVQESTKLPQKYTRLKSDTSPLYTELFSQWKKIENMYINASALFIAAAKKEIHSAIYDVEQRKETYFSNGFDLSLQVKRKSASFLALKTLLDKFEEERNGRLKNLGSEFVLEDFYSERVLKPMEEKTNYKTEALPKPNSDRQQTKAAADQKEALHPQLFSPSLSAPSSSSVANHQLVLLLQKEPSFFQSMDQAVLMLQKRKKEQKKEKEKEKEKEKIEMRTTQEDKTQNALCDPFRWRSELARNQSREQRRGQTEEFSFNSHLLVCLINLRNLYKMLDSRFHQDTCLIAYLLDLHHEGLTHQFQTKITAIKKRSEELKKNFVDQKSKLLLHYEETSQAWNRRAKKFQTQLLQWLNFFNNHQSSVMNLLHLLLFQNSKNKKWEHGAGGAVSSMSSTSDQKNASHKQKTKKFDSKPKQDAGIGSKEDTETEHFSAALDLASFLKNKKNKEQQKQSSKLSQTEPKKAQSAFLPKTITGPGTQTNKKQTKLQEQQKEQKDKLKVNITSWNLRYQELRHLALLIHKYSTELHKVTILASVDEIKETKTKASLELDFFPSSRSSSGSSSSSSSDLDSSSTFVSSSSLSRSLSNDYFPFSNPTLHSTSNHFQLRRIEQEVKKRRSLSERLPGLFELGTPIESSLCFQVQGIYHRWVSFLNRKECKDLLHSQKKRIQAVCSRYLKEFECNKKKLKELQHKWELLANERQLLFETSSETETVSLDSMKTIERLQKMLCKLEPEIERVSRLQTNVHKAYVAAQRKENLILKDPPEERTINKICDMYSVLLLEKIKFSQEFHDQLRTIHLTYKNQQEFFQSAQVLEFETEIKNLFLIRRTREWDTWKIFEELLLNHEEKIQTIQKHFQSLITNESKSNEWLGRELIHLIRGMTSKWEDYLERYTLTRLNFNLVHLEILARVLEKTNM